MSILASKLFLADMAERAVKTAAQTAVALLTASGVSLVHYDWTGFGSTVGLATLLSVLSSISSAGSGNSASLVIDNVKEK